MDADDAPRTGEQLRDNTRLVFLETPSNPLCKIVDIAAVRQAADAVGAMVVVDNTFATPYHQKPLEHGADLVVHSATKALGGHNDIMAGAIAGLKRYYNELWFTRQAIGTTLDAYSAFLLDRGLKTFDTAAMARAQVIAEHLQPARKSPLFIRPAHSRARHARSRCNMVSGACCPSMSASTRRTPALHQWSADDLLRQPARRSPDSSPTDDDALPAPERGPPSRPGNMAAVGRDRVARPARRGSTACFGSTRAGSRAQTSLDGAHVPAPWAPAHDPRVPKSSRMIVTIVNARERNIPPAEHPSQNTSETKTTRSTARVPSKNRGSERWTRGN